MKISAISSLLLLANTVHGHLRAVDSCSGATSKATCQKTKDEDSNACVWCESRAVSSGCFSKEQSEQLPPSVFQCESPNDQDENVLKDEELGLTRTSFNFVEEEDVTHSLLHKVHEAGDDAICDGSSKSISGYMDIKGSKYDENNDKHLFFWMFEKRPSKEEDVVDDAEVPFIVWLTGGPGCSSTLALLTENGPCSVNDDGATTKVNPYSWSEAANVLWLDQPAGVGFSYGEENDSNEAMISEDAYFFLQAFFQTYPQYARKDPFLYIVGESYGGHYAPAIAHRVWQGNQMLAEKDGDSTFVKLPLGGLGIGNGLTDPEVQYAYYPQMVFNNSHHIKVVDEATYETMKAVVPKCQKLIHQCNKGDNAIDNFACQTAFVVCNMGLTSPYQMTGLNPYDIRKKCEKPPLCYDFSATSDWLNKQSTMKALGVDTSHVHRWDSCNFGINMKFHTDWMKDFSPFVLDLLDKAGVPVLIYAGDVDFICNYLGNQAWSVGLPWSGAEGFQKATPTEWKGAGLARVNPDDKKFTFLQVYDAGHMVPSDQPKVALDMIKTFVNGDAFA
ncbi:Carboxypeptidase Y homolog A [Seminavis robusta]|uniref:Carboxypeptidase n=1 Tax=Seminavis robusta TaxID=568900 RepID=A0A9N8H175_9STRA|nr:Carboxypeptidase Y homolog A [Seminavis robusta]|eukprot:Sro12_g009350.1 Carboxypeptidase Y homolog A (559) ;mRNA; r:94989-97174